MDQQYDLQAFQMGINLIERQDMHYDDPALKELEQDEFEQVQNFGKIKTLTRASRGNLIEPIIDDK